MIDLLRILLRNGWTLLVLLLFSVGAFAQGNNAQRRTFIAGEIILSVPHGTPRAEVNGLVGGVNAEIIYAYGPLDFEKRWDVYYARIKGANVADKETLEAIAKLKTDQRVRYAGPNHVATPDQVGGPVAIPNDPFFNQLWGMTMINMPQAWTLEKGQSNVVVVVVDTGVDIDHPEFQGRVMGGLDTNDPNNVTTDPRPKAAGDEHGTHVAGTAIAAANNGIGVAGAAWEKVRLFAINAIGSNTQGEASVLKAWSELLTLKNNNPTLRFVANNSFNLGDSTTDAVPPPGTDPACDALLNLAKNGIIMVMSAGNRGSPGDTNPPRRIARMAAAHPNILSVAAVNHLGQRAYYSSYRPTNTIAAPGGDALAGQLILSTWPGNQYQSLQGTSMSTPHVTGVIALMLSIPSVQAADVKGVLTSTARPVPGFAVPSPEFGYGIMDAYAALLKVAVSVSVVEPDGTGGKASQGALTRQPDPVETLRPTVRFRVSQITPANLVIKLDGEQYTGYTIEDIRATVKDASGADVPILYDAVVRTRDFSPGRHSAEITGTKPGPPDVVVSDIRYFVVEPHQVPAGRAMISIPYSEAGVTPESYFGTGFRLARWVPTEGLYRFYSSFGEKNPLAGFNPPDTAPHVDGETTPLYPIGLAYWSDVESVKPILTRGAPVLDKTFVIPLRGNGTGDRNFISWNMVGCPFPYDVPFNSLLVDTPEGRLTINAAVAKGYLLPNVYSYDPTFGYTFRTLPDGVLQAWTGHWIGVTSRENIALVVPPARVTRAARPATRGTAASGSGWKLQLSASVRGLQDVYNFIGSSSRAADGYDLSDVPKPPMVAPYVTLGILNDGWGNRSGLYAQDIRSTSRTQSWTVVVSTDQTDTDVTVRWNSISTLPRNVKLVIKDETTGQMVDMRARSFLTFHTGTEATTRRFTITSRTATPGALRISNVSVRSDNSSRASGTAIIGFTLSSDASYEVSVLNAAGATVNTIATRTAGAGDVRLVWNGRDRAGRGVPAGTYLVQIRATGSDGDSVKVIQPFALLR